MPRKSFTQEDNTVKYIFGGHFGKCLPFLSQDESAMSLYPKIFVKAPPNCVPNFMLVSSIAQFFQIMHLSAVLYSAELDAPSLMSS